MERLSAPHLPRASPRVYPLMHSMKRRASTSRFGWLFALAAAFGAGLLVASPLAHVLTHSLQGRHTHLPNGQVIYDRGAPASEHKHEVRDTAPPGAPHRRDHEHTRPAVDTESPPQSTPTPKAAPDSQSEGERSSGGHTDGSVAHFALLTVASSSFVYSVARPTSFIEPPRPTLRDAPSFQLELATAPRGPPGSRSQTETL